MFRSRLFITLGIVALLFSYLPAHAIEPGHILYLRFVEQKETPPDVNQMITIPAGPFQMGCNPSNPSDTCFTNEMPLHIVVLSVYEIDKYEVTNIQYAACVAAGACTQPAFFSSGTRASYYDNPEYTYYPVMHLTYYQATQFCSWAGKRLPSEAEWEKAARGDKDARAYPWLESTPGGSQPLDPTRLNADGYVGDTTRVGSYPTGASPYGVMDMVGNVREWVADWYDARYYSLFPVDGWPGNPTGPANGILRITRGGSWFDIAFVDRVAFRFPYEAGRITGVGIGFRCARYK